MFDKTALVTVSAAEFEQAVFERRQRTRQLQKLNRDAPRDGGKMRKNKGAPPKNQRRAEDCEKHEAEMENENNVGEQSINHFFVVKRFCRTAKSILF